MRRTARRVLPALALLLVGTTAQAQYTAYAISTGPTGQRLVTFNTATPGTVTNVGVTGASLIGIDFRPVNGVLYGFDGDRLYTVSTTTGAATPLFDVSNTSGSVGFDFNPAADRLRVVDAAGTNLRLNPNDGATLGDPGYTYGAGAFAGQVPSLTGAAYTNNDNDPATATALYGIDASRGLLVQLVNPNGGTANVVGGLTGVTASAISGFDIVTVGGVNLAFLTAFNATNALSSLYTLDLGTGAASLVGTIGGVGGGVAGLAIVPAVSAVPEPGTVFLLGGGLAMVGLVARRRRAAAARA